MDVNKMINEFKTLNDTLNTYKNIENNVIQFIKELNKDTNKLEDKIKKETDVLMKEYYRMKIITNRFYVNKLNTIFNFETKSKKEIKND